MAFSSPFMAKSPLHELSSKQRQQLIDESNNLKDNVGEIDKGNLDPKEGEEFRQPDTVINAYPGYRKTKNSVTGEEKTSQEEYDANEDFPRIDKFTGEEITKNN